MLIEHIYTDGRDPSHRIAIVTTNVNPKPKAPEGYTWVYRCNAYPTRAQEWLKAKTQFLDLELIIPEERR